MTNGAIERQVIDVISSKGGCTTLAPITRTLPRLKRQAIKDALYRLCRRGVLTNCSKYYYTAAALEADPEECDI